MKITVKKYVAKVAEYVEHDNGTITKETRLIEIKGQRMSEAGVLKQIPRNAQLVEHGYVEKTFNVDTDKLISWLAENGEVVENNTESEAE